MPISEAAHQLHISRTAVYELAKAGRLIKIKIGRKGLITTASIDALVESLASLQDEQPLEVAGNRHRATSRLAQPRVHEVDGADSTPDWKSNINRPSAHAALPGNE
ncbi:MAG: helix-turn-helix domain-containing protein [Mycobacterium sp.]|nr:helix-turn-helix domain-containing protein [Mycobacterium sp.]